MKLKIILATVAATALMGGAALAQPTDQSAAPSSEPAPAAAPASSSSEPATAATGTASQTSVTTSDPATGASTTMTTTTNGPVPDTAENRKKYGGPMSHAGKRTAAKGN